jgi:hypothetical protein
MTNLLMFFVAMGGIPVSQGGVSLGTNARNERTLAKRVRASYIVITVPVFDNLLLI